MGDYPNEKIDPVPAPQACIDGIARHFQQYEASIIALKRENQELRSLLEAANHQIDILRA